MGTLRWFQLERAVGVWWSSSRKTPQELLWIGLSWHIACTSYATHTQAFNCHFPYFALVSQIYAPKRGITEAAHWFHKPDALPAAPSTVTKYWRIPIGSAVFSFTHMVSAPHVKPTVSQHWRKWQDFTARCPSLRQPLLVALYNMQRIGYGMLILMPSTQASVLHVPIYQKLRK